MGYQLEWEPDAENVYLTSGRDNLALHAWPASRPLPKDSGLLDHIGIALPKADDVDAWAEWLGAAGVELETTPRTHRDGARSLYFRDPGGVLVQLIHHQPLVD